MRVKTIFGALLSFAVLFSFGPVSHAQNVAPSLDDVLKDAPGAASGLPSCFEYYRFGSTPVRLSAELTSISAGAPIVFSGAVTNENEYPVVDTVVYVKIFKQHESADKNPNGPDVVGFFPVTEALTLAPHETRPLAFEWKVPTDIEAGNYRIAAFVAAQERFNYLGLTFTDDVTGGFYDFSIINDRSGGVRFDKESATLNGADYLFAVFAPIFPSDITDVEARVSLTNTTDVPFEGTVEWKLYSWDALQEENLIEEGTSEVRLHPGGSQELSYIVTDTEKTVYYLVGALTTSEGSQSVVGFRFVRAQHNEPRVNSIGVTSYPAEAGTLAFACFHDTGSSVAENTKIELSIIPTNFGILSFLAPPSASKIYEGVAPGNLVALTVPFEDDLSSFSLVARIYQDGKLLDTITTSYHCDELGVACKGDSMVGGLLSLLAAVVLVVIIVLIVHRRKRPIRTMNS